MKESVRVETSATIANFGPGFDTFGMCLDRPTEIIEVEATGRSGISIEVKRGGFNVPKDPRLNTSAVAAAYLLKSARAGSTGLKIKINKLIRPGSGLGSSAASAVGGALGAAALLGIDDLKKILKAASIGEGATSGAPHLDNVSPCLFGGFTAVVKPDTLDILQIEPSEMQIVVCLPDITVKTESARKIIPRQITVDSAISHVGWASGMVVGLNNGDIDLMAACMNDEIAVPARKKLIKGYDSVRKAAIRAGAKSFSISGSGPAVFSLATGHHKEIGKSMVEAFGRAGVASDYFIARPGKGARVLS